MLRRACILGASLDVGNRGVLALGVSVAGLFARVSPQTVLAFHYSHHAGGLKRLPVVAGGERTIEVLNCRMSPRSAPGEHILAIVGLALLHRLGFKSPARRNPWLRSLLTADFIGDIRGGDSFSDIYGVRRFLEGSLPLVSVALLRRPFTMLPQTYGPFRSVASRILARWLLRRATRILTRDKNCRPLVARLSGRTPVFCPDVAFTLDAIMPARLSILPGEFDWDANGRVVIGINVSGLLYMRGYTGRNTFGIRADYAKLIDRLVERLLTSTDARILLVPHVFGSEQEEDACASILQSAGARFPDRVFAIAGALTEREIKWVVGRTSFFIGSRMHACIAALSQCVPSVGLAYSDKFLGVFDSVGATDATIDLRRFDLSEVVERIASAFDNRDELRERLLRQVPAVREQVISIFQELAGDGRTQTRPDPIPHQRPAPSRSDPH